MQEGGAVAYLPKHAFKLPSTLEVRIQTMRESESSRWQNAAKDYKRNDEKVLIYARVVGAVHACWSLY